MISLPTLRRNTALRIAFLAFYVLRQGASARLNVDLLRRDDTLSNDMFTNNDRDEDTYTNSNELWHQLLVSAMLVLAGGLCAGLTLGLMGLDDLHLRVLAASSDNPQEKRNARTVLDLLNGKRHWVLVVLLLSNVIVNESLPIFLDNAVSVNSSAILLVSHPDKDWRRLCCNYYINSSNRYLWASRVPSIRWFESDQITSLIPWYFSNREIIPQAISVHHGLRIGALCAPAVQVMMFLMAPIAYPISWILDFLLGNGECHLYKKAELKSLLQLHGSGSDPLSTEEITIMKGVLGLGSKSIQSIATPLARTMTLSSDAVLDQSLFDALCKSGLTRFPVHLPGRPTAFAGVLLINQLLGYDPSQALPVSSFTWSGLPEAHTSTKLLQALDYFQSGSAHLVLISRTPGREGGAVGFVSRDDIFEAMLKEEDTHKDGGYIGNAKLKDGRTLSDIYLPNLISEGDVNGDESIPMLHYSTDREETKEAA